jgi:hypothetical protein
METVTIGCRLPSGIELEVGYETSVTGTGGAPFARYRKLADYQSVRLKGTNQHLLLREPGTGKILQSLPGKRDREPFLNPNVPADFWERWCKEHADSPLLKTGQLFVVPKPADTKSVVADAKATSPALFEPLDPGAVFNVEMNAISKRVDEE